MKKLIEKTLKAEINRNNSVSETIVYTYTDGEQVNTKAIPQKIVFGELGKDTEKDFVIFHAIELPSKPNKGDSIRWGDMFFNVEKITLLSNEMESEFYDIRAFSYKNKTGGGLR